MNRHPEELAKLCIGRFINDDTSYDIVFIGGLKNIVYKVTTEKDLYILRITASTHRQFKELLSEVNWLNALEATEVHVSTPIKSLSGNQIEKFEYKDTLYFGSLFTFAKGERMSYPDYLEDGSIFKKLGNLTGTLHAISKTIKVERFSIMDERYMESILLGMTNLPEYVYDALARIKNEIDAIERKSELFGLIHGDINVGNFHMDSFGQVTLFDFDECHYSWYVDEIAIQLYYTIYVILDDSIPKREEIARHFMAEFIPEYQKKTSLPKEMLELIPLLLRLREVIVHIGIHKACDLKNLSSWPKDYYEQSRKRIMAHRSIY